MIGTILGAIGGLAGSLLSSNSARKSNKRQYDLARNTIQYRTEDAKKAGIHPLYALGAPTLSSTVQTDPLGAGVTRASDDIARGLNLKRKQPLEQLQMEKLRAEIGETKARTDYTMEQLANSKHQRLVNSVRGIGQPRTTPNIGNPKRQAIVAKTKAKNEKLREYQMPFKSHVSVNPKRATAQAIEDEYGDVVSMAYGVGSVAEDAYDGVKKWVRKKFKWTKKKSKSLRNRFNNYYKGK